MGLLWGRSVTARFGVAINNKTGGHRPVLSQLALELISQANRFIDFAHKKGAFQNEV